MSDLGLDVVVSGQTDGSEDRIASEFEQALTRAFSKAAKQIAADFRRIFSSGGASGLGRDLGRLGRQMSESLSQATASARRLNAEIERLSKSLRSGEFVKGAGLDLYAEAIARNTDLTRRFAAEREEIARDSGLARAFRQEATAIRSSLQSIDRELVSLRREQDRVAQRGADSVLQAQRSATAITRSEAAERIAIAQIEGSRSTAEFRAAAQRRLEIFRQVFTQIKLLERGLGTAFSATARTITSALSGIASRVGRTNQAFTQGTSQALNQRTSIIQRAFSRQERIVTDSVLRQSATLQRFDRQLSTGVIGAAAGRSQAANILGLGAGVAGGLGFIQVLRNGITAGADFTQGLAVLDAQLQLTDDQLAAVRQTALDLGNDISLPGVSALDAAQAIGLLTKQFGNLGSEAPAAAQNAAKGVLALSRATQASAEDSAQIVGAAVNVFGVGAERATEVADKVAVALANAAGTSTTDFAQAFRQGANVFNLFQGQALGAEGALTEFNAALAVLAREGIVGSDAGTSLKQFFLQGTRQADEAIELSNELAAAAGEAGNVFFDQEGKARRLSEAMGILRTATAGMTEEQRNAALGVLFGSDAVRAANALIGTTAEDYLTLIARLQREGAAAEIAAAQNQGLRGALDALGSVVETQLILAYEKFQAVLGRVVLGVAEFFNNLASGEGIFAAVRTGLKGVGLGLGALLGVKVVAEGFGLLGTALRFALTPMGAIVLAAAGLGAAFTLLRDRSETFRNIVGEVRDGFIALVNAFNANDPDQTSSGFPGFMERIGTQARIAFNYIGDTVIPTIGRLARSFAGEVVERARAFGRFFAEDILPPVQRFVGYIRDDLIPRLAELGGNLLGPVIDRVRGLASALRDLVAINPGAFFATLGASVAGAVGGFALGGPVGALIGGAGAGIGALFAQGFGDEVVSVLQGLGSRIVDGLRAGLRVVGGLLADVFTVDNLLGAGGFAVGLAGTIGRALGNVLSDPRVVAAAAGIAAFAGAAAANFVKGFAEGVLSNVPGLANLIGDGLKEAFDSLTAGALGFLPTDFLVKLLLGAGAVAAVTVAFRKLGGTINKAISDGVRSSGGLIGSSGIQAAGGTNGPRGLLAGLFGSPADVQAASRRAAFNAIQSFRQEFDRNNRILRAAGQGIDIGQVFSRAELEASRVGVQRLTTELGAARVQGLLARTAFRDLGTAIRNLDTRGAASALRDLGGVLRTNGRDIGIAAGTAIGAGLGVGFSAELATSGGIGNFFSGLLGIGGSIATAFAIGGAPLAGIAAGIGGITFALRKAGEAAERAKQETREYYTTLAEADANRIVESAGETVLANLKDEGDDLRRVLGQAGFDAEAFAERVIDGTSSANDEIIRLARGIGATSEELAALRRNQVIDFGGLTLSADPALRSLTQRFKDLGLSTGEIRDLFDFLSDESGELAEALGDVQLDKVLTDLSGTGSNADAAADAIGRLKGSFSLLFFVERLRLGADLADAEEKARLAENALKNATIAAQDFLDGDYRGTLQEALDAVTLGIPGLTTDLEGLSGKVGEELAALQRRNNDSVQTDLRAVVRAAIDADLVAGDVPDPRDTLQALRDRLQAEIEADPGSTSVPAKLTVIANIDQLLADPNLQENIDNLVAEIAGLVPTTGLTVPIDGNPIVSMDSADLASAIATAVALAGGGSTGGPFGESRGFRSAVTAIDVPFAINPQVSLAPGVESGIAAVGRSVAAIMAAGIRGGTALVATAARALGGAASGAARINQGSVFQAGVDVASGLAQGIRAGTGGAVAAARAMAQAVTAVTKAALKIGSPSRVFAGIGYDIGRGLAQGIADSEGDISNVLSDVLSNVTNRAVSQSELLAGAGADIFRLLQPQGANGRTDAGGITNLTSLTRLMPDLQAVFDDAAKSLFESVAAGAEGSSLQRLIAAQFQGFGVGFSSLDRNTILGAQNVEGILQVTERIRDFIGDALASGASFDTVIGQAQRYIDQVREVGAQYGASAADINSLLAAQGLSAEALAQLRTELTALRQATAAGATRTVTDEESDAERSAREERDRQAQEREEAFRARQLELLRIAIDRPTEVTVVPPYGDPEAIALAVANRTVYNLSIVP